MSHANPAAVDLNPEQREVVEHVDGPLLTIAVAGCLAGDTRIGLNRAGKSFDLPLSDVVKLQHGGRPRHGRAWDLSIPTMVRFRDTDGYIRLGALADAYESGLKTTYTVRTRDGHTLRATADHQFLTDTGWRPLSGLSVGDRVFVEVGPPRPSGKAPSKPWYRYTCGIPGHPYAIVRTRHGQKEVKGVATHRLVMEAALNELDYSVYIRRLRTGAVVGLRFLGEEWTVHHKDEDPRNNRLENLVLLRLEEHHQLHGRQDGWQRLTSRTGLDEIVAIEEHGMEPTYDLAMEAEPHNFLANGVVVHNSGKTAAVVARVARLVERGVNPKKILAVTFSRKAANEMNERLAKLLGPRSGARIGTFHSVALEIFRAETPDGRSWELNEKTYRRFIKQAIGFQEMEWKEADVTLIESFISRCMCDLELPDSDGARDRAEALYAKRRRPDAIPEKLIQVYTRAEELRIEKRNLTFDSMMRDAVLLLRGNQEVRERWAAKFNYVVADEGQDSNLAQIEMAELLSALHRNYNAVGDPGQNIFSWRGARPERLVRFVDRWPDAKVVTMNRNYRCGSTIIAVANRTLDRMDPATRLPLTILAERGTEGTVTSIRYVDFDEEALAIATRVQGEREDGQKLKDSAVLYRTQAQSRALEEAFLALRLPYVIHGGVNFYERSEVSDLLAYLRLALGHGGAEDVTRCLNKPFRFLGKVFLGRVIAAGSDFLNQGRTWTTVVREVVAEGDGLQRRQIASAEQWCDLIEEIAKRVAKWNPKLPPDGQKDGSPAGLLELVLTRTDYQEWLRKEEGDETVENSRVSNVRELVRVATRFQTVSEFLQYIDETIEASREAAKKNEMVDAVTFITIHSSKGLEWPTVYLIGVNDGILPHARAEDPEEERRLFYVACTRARDALHLSCVRTAVVGGKVRQMVASSYLQDAGIPLLEAGEEGPQKPGTPVPPLEASDAG